MWGRWDPDEKTVLEAMKRMDAARDAYLKKFGEHSLDYAIVHDPTWASADNFNVGAEALENAIRTNSPIPNENSELFKSLIF